VILVGSAIGESVERMCGEHDGQLAAAAAMNADDALARETIAYAA
jgi:hypothetical protein